MKHPTLRLALAAILLTSTLQGQAPQVPPLVNYQGRVAVDAVNFEGAGLFKFALVNEDGSITFWSNDGTSAAGSEPTDAVSLTVAKGLYSVLLGDIALANMTAIPASVFANADVRLRVWFDDGVNGSQLLTPDQRLAPSAYLADGAVTSASIADDAITTAKIAPAAIDGTRIAPGSLDFSHLTVPAAPGAGQVLGFDGATLNWVPANGGGGDSVFTLSGANAFYSYAGNVGIGMTAPVHRLGIAFAPAWTSNSWGGGVELGNGIAIGWQANAAGRSFGMGHTNGGFGLFRTNSTPGTTGSPSLYDLFINDSGNVGINTISPASKFTIVTSSAGLGAFRAGLEHTDGAVRIGTYAEPSFGGWIGTISNHPLNFFTNDGLPSLTIDTGGATVMTPNGSAGSVTFGSPNGENGLSIIRAGNRADVRFEGATLKMVVGPVGGPPASTRGIAVTTAGNVGIGTTNPSRTLEVAGDVWFRDASVRVLTIRGGADLAEPFAMSHADVTPGTVVIIDTKNPGKLRKSATAYDKKVAGIVSGADGIRPGISMIQEDMLEAGENVALSGRVYVKANTNAGAIEPGDLLTTSDVPGEAMKAADHSRAQGAILGKAMTALPQGDGTVLVLVTLQ